MKITYLCACVFLWQEFNCNGTVVEHAEYGEVIQLQGDKRDAMKNFLVEVGIATSDLVKVCPKCCAYGDPWQSLDEVKVPQIIL